MMNTMFKFLMGAVCAAVLPAFGQGEKTDFPTDKAVTVFSAGAVSNTHLTLPTIRLV